MTRSWSSSTGAAGRRVPAFGGVYIAAASGCHRLRPPTPPFVPIRERLRDAVESFFSCHFDLFVEFTGLVSWCKGASIGWHSDDNKPYLRQRAFTAVCYLNNHGKDFKGGLLKFQDGEPSSVIPVAGDAVIYTADNRNVHCVDEVTEGERLTLTLWFTRDTSDNMYWFSSRQSGFDIRCARIHILGFNFRASSDEDSKSTSAAPADDLIELLGKPLRIGRGDDVFGKIFANSLHALQVVQFYYWKAPELAARRNQTNGGSETVCYPTIQVHQSSGTELPLPCNHGLAQTIFGSYSNVDSVVEWDDVVLALAMWENYSEELKRKLSTFLPYWLSNGTIFVVDP
ncbi:hypothetical protein ZWY2020_007886 [Hordeum vulgare]|nr:hypothetical protein ZWY2020_007886 [Hordeum vulgare]